MLRSPEVVVQDGREEEEDKVGKEPNVLQTFPSDEFVVDDQGREVVSTESDPTVEQVPVPTDDDRVVSGTDDLDERRLEQLVTVETEIVGKPTKGGGKESPSKVVEDEFERGNVVSGLIDPSVLLGSHQSGGRVLELVETVVGQPEGGQGHDPELDSEDPLGRDLAVRRVAASVVETQEEDDQDGLVEELTPTLHEKGEDDVPTTVKFVISTVDRLATSLGLVLERRGGSHGVPEHDPVSHRPPRPRSRSKRNHSLSTDTDPVDEQTPSVHDRPSAQASPPHGGQHDQPDKHDQGVLDQSEFPADPISFETDEDLTDHDTDDLEVGLLGGAGDGRSGLGPLQREELATHRSDPVLAAHGVVLPTSGPDGLEEGSEVSDREQGVTFGEKTEPVQDVSTEGCRKTTW
jgi:hypothetical protein